MSYTREMAAGAIDPFALEGLGCQGMALFGGGGADGLLISGAMCIAHPWEHSKLRYSFVVSD